MGAGRVGDGSVSGYHECDEPEDKGDDIQITTQEEGSAVVV